jgi:hypothetical protein
MRANMAAINIQKYIDSIKYTRNVDVLNGAPDLNAEQIAQFDEPYRKLLYAYYGYITQLDNYTLDELNERFYLAIYYNNLKLIKYFDSNIFCF